MLAVYETLPCHLSASHISDDRVCVCLCVCVSVCVCVCRVSVKLVEMCRLMSVTVVYLSVSCLAAINSIYTV